jgi:hypothetical protein
MHKSAIAASLGWFALYWRVNVAALGVVAYVIRWVIS